MKKQFLYLMAAAASLTACSTNDVIGDAGNEGNVDGTVDAQYDGSINIGATINALSITTKASGTRATVGGMENDANNNVWSGKEPLYFFMMEKGTIKPATELKSNSTSEYQNIYWNELAYATTGETAGKATVVVTRNDKAIKYYPISDAWDNGTYGFDFYGYHGGTATVTDNKANEPKYYSATTGEDGTIKTEESDVEKGNIVGVAFTIDGSQDIMSGKAVVTDAQKAKLAEGEDKRAFSAYTARRGVQPSIDFNHRLTRLVFKVKPGEASTAGYATKQTEDRPTSPTANDTVEAMKVVGIKVVGKYKNKGLIVAASTDDTYQNKLIWTAVGESETNTFELKDKDDKVISKDGNNAATLTGTFTNKTFSGTETAIGDALMLEPGYEAYDVVLTLEQRVCENINNKKKDGQGETTTGWTTKYQEVTGTIKAPTGTDTGKGKFTEGYSYEVKITVHGFQPIDVTANLIGWKNGGDTDADTDNMKPYKEETKTE